MTVPKMPEQGLGLMFIHASWCQPCQRTKPGIKEIDEEREDLTVVMIDGDEDLDTPMEVGLKTYPTLILTKDGEEIARRGSGNKAEINAWIDENLPD